MSDAPDMEDLIETNDPSFGHVMACVFGIQEHESRTYLRLLDNPGSTVEELASVLDRDRSNVNRSLTTLLEKGLARRERRLLDPGGYVYQYTATPLPEAKELLHAALDEWAETVHEVIETFDDRNEVDGE
ncbi:helix-turn-helix domain-containing protein [Halobaculum gomorrense]|uniref:Predicted transcriptional regulator n=1 Tax=Halobaculum gomorrense TaxID=43928 RepID=A0A1M5QDA2_9EURY|nr:helix-turn-helix domain-containing protein [Halobaculum gomorrense]SHH12022.1 Predicted transcriptional regulator [Halobaculum gomorrense]